MSSPSFGPAQWGYVGDVGQVLPVPREGAQRDCRDRVGLERQGGLDAEVAAAGPAQGPEEVGMMLVVDGEQVPLACRLR
jgi:hypothetical protein